MGVGENDKVIAFRPGPELRAWIDQQAAAMGWARSQVIRYYLETAMGTDPAASVLQQYMIQSTGHLKERMHRAMQVVIPKFANILTEALMLDSSDPDQLERAVDGMMKRADQQPSAAQPKRKKKRRQKKH